MCGISGIIDFNARSPGSMVRDLNTMHAQIPHRGPTGEGFLIVDNQMRAARGDALASLAEVGDAPRIGLAFRWLAIQDLGPAANQPMTNDGGRLWIVFNGEIYNFVELRDALAREGALFQTEADSEVILA